MREVESLTEQSLMEDPPEYQHPEENSYGEYLVNLFRQYERTIPEM